MGGTGRDQRLKTEVLGLSGGVMDLVKCPEHGKAPVSGFPSGDCGTGLEWQLLISLFPQEPSAS